VTAGPGVTNTVTAIKNAQMAQSPVVLLGGAAATLLKGKGSLQDIDQMAVLSPIVKYAVACTTVREIVPALRKAFQEAASGVPGGCDSVITSTLLAAVSLLLSVFSVE
jgi:acetolactate synthase-like protein